MKKIISTALTAAMLLTGVVSAYAADDAVPAAEGLVLAESSRLKLDLESGFIDMIDGTITVADLKANFAGDVSVADKADDAAVATDDVITAGDESIKAVIWGDVDRNAKINLSDVAAMMKSVAMWDVDLSETAADVDRDGKLKLADVSKMLKKIAGWDDISLGNVRMVNDNLTVTAENEDKDISAYFESSLVKVPRSDVTNTGMNTYKMKLAKNETESCQLLLASSADKEGLTIEMTPFEHEFGEGTLETELNLEYYYEMSVFNYLLPYDTSNVTEDYFVDPLLPATAPFELTAERSQGFMVNVTAGKDAAPGMYKATVTVKDADGKEIKQANVFAYVWDFTLPDTPYSASSFGMTGYDIYAHLGLYEGDDSKTHREYYEFMLDHNLSCYQLPYQVTDPRADELMSDPRVTSFEICGENLRRASVDNPEYIKATYAKIQTNEEWAKKGHFYYVDEPINDGLTFVKGDHEYLTELLGTDDFNMVVPLAGNSYADQECLNEGIDAIEYLTPYINIWCPQSPFFEPSDQGGLWQGRRSIIKYGEFQGRYEALRANENNKMWWYVCISPQPPYANFFSSYQGTPVRMVLWQQFQYDIDGLLYWATQYGWSQKNPATYVMGDGTLLYMGEKYGYTGPCASIRLIQIRDGFDDFDYLRMAEEIVGREEALKYLEGVSEGLRIYTEDNTVMEAQRDALGDFLEENYNK